MINKRRFAINISSSLFQSVFIAVLYYFFYKFLLKRLGVEQMGVWSIVLAISSTANVTNLGIGSSVVRFTAKFNFTNDGESVNKLLHTAFFLIGGLFFLTGLIIYFLIGPYWLSAVIKKEFLPLALAMMPYSIVCLWLNAISNSVFLPCMDGLQKSFYKNILNIICSLLMLLASIWLVPKYGLLGIAYAQILQAATLLISSAVILKVIYKPVHFFSFHWDKQIMKQIFSFGIREQVISVAQLCFDPLTRSLLGRFGGLEFSAYYEMANRLVTQTRALLISANQLMTPLFAEATERKDNSLNELYIKNFLLNYLLSLLWLGGVIGGSFIISVLLIGNINYVFICCALILSFATFFNILSVPAYFSNMGSAYLRPNVIGNLVICLLNLFLGWILGKMFFGFGVVSGWAMALMTGSVYIFYFYHVKHNIRLNLFLHKNNVYNSILALFFIIIISLLFIALPLQLWQMTVIVVGMFGLFCILPFIKHPQVKAIINYVQQKLLSKDERQ